MITVPTDKCPMDVIAKLGERTKDAWIFLHKSTVEKLKSTSDGKGKSVYVSNMLNGDTPQHTLLLFWEAMGDSPATDIEILDTLDDWAKVCCINAVDIAFTKSCDNPKEIFLLKMAEN